MAPPRSAPPRASLPPTRATCASGVSYGELCEGPRIFAIAQGTEVGTVALLLRRRTARRASASHSVGTFPTSRSLHTRTTGPLNAASPQQRPGRETTQGGRAMIGQRKAGAFVANEIARSGQDRPISLATNAPAL